MSARCAQSTDAITDAKQNALSIGMTGHRNSLDLSLRQVGRGHDNDVVGWVVAHRVTIRDRADLVERGRHFNVAAELVTPEPARRANQSEPLQMWYESLEGDARF